MLIMQSMVINIYTSLNSMLCYVGYIQNWRTSMLVLTLVLIVGAVLFFIGAYVKCIDYRPEEERLSLEKGHRLTATNAGNVGPLVSDMETATLIHNHGDITEGSHV